MIRLSYIKKHGAPANRASLPCSPVRSKVHRQATSLSLSTIEIAAVKARWREELCRALPELTGAADALLARISPPNWTLEWSLPLWLGEGLGLSRDFWFELVVGNVFGLTYVRLQDDLVDGDVSPEGGIGALRLSTELYHQWLATYRPLFDCSSIFWDHFERYLGQWRRATLTGSQQLNTPLKAFTEADFLMLGQRGAPLKICAAGACLLAESQDLLPQLEAILDELLIGAVLLDHAMDWASDLMAGRFNTFIAHVSPHPQTEAFQEANRLAVLDGTFRGVTAFYFAPIRARLQKAADNAAALGFPVLADYVIWLRNEADHYGRRLTRTARLQLRAATVELFS